MMTRASAVVLLALITAAPGAPGPGLPARVTYQFGLLRLGPQWTPERMPATDSIQAGHMANIGRMFEEGLLVASGPVLRGGQIRGVFVFRDDSLARLRERVARDPAVRSGRLVMDLHPWIAPAGIGAPYRRMAAQTGHRDSMCRFPLALMKRGSAAALPESLRKAHDRAIVAGLASGELASAGPFLDDGDIRGIVVFRGDSTAAQRWVTANPAVRAGHLTTEMLTWFAAWGTWPGDTLAPPR